MFGLSKREKEEKEFLECFESMLRELLNTFFLPLAQVASDHQIKISEDGNIYLARRYLIVIKAFAVEIGQKVNADPRAIDRGLRAYLSGFDEGKDMYRKMADINPNQYAALINAVKMAATLYSSNKERNASLMTAVAHTYLFESPR